MAKKFDGKGRYEPPRRQPVTLEDEILRNLRLWVLKCCKGNRSQAAEILGIDVRSLRLHLAAYIEDGYLIREGDPQRRRSELDATFYKELRAWVEGRTTT